MGQSHFENRHVTTWMAFCEPMLLKKQGKIKTTKRQLNFYGRLLEVAGDFPLTKLDPFARLVVIPTIVGLVKRYEIESASIGV